MEMFACRKEKVSEPIVQPYASSYTKARKYYQGDGGNVDFAACGNALRQAIEGAFKMIYTRLGITKNADGSSIDFSKTMLGDYIHLSKTHFPDLNIPLDAIHALDSIKIYCSIHLPITILRWIFMARSWKLPLMYIMNCRNVTFV